MKNAALDFGAVGDNLFDNLAALTAAINHANATGEKIHIPRGLYRYSAPLPPLTSGGLVGDGAHACFYSHDVPEAGPHGTVLRAAFASGDNLRIARGAYGVSLSGLCFWPVPFRTSGYEILDQGADTLIDDVSSACVYGFIKFGGGANGSTARRVRAVGVRGGHGILVQGSSPALPDWAQGIVIENYGFYNPWQVAEATNALVKGNWAAGTVYGLGDIVFGSGYVLQCRAPGTSGGTSPAIPAFAYAGAPTGTNILDGTCAWRLIMGQWTTGVCFDSNSAVVTLDKAQINSAVTGALLNNSLAGSAPQTIKIANSLIDHSIRDCIQGNVGADLTVRDCNLQLSAIGRGATLQSGMLGPVAVEGGRIWGNALHGIAFGGGNPSRVRLRGIHCGGNGVAAPNVHAGIWAVPNTKRFEIADCFAGDDPAGMGPQKYGIQVDAGCDDFVIAGNVCKGNGSAGILNSSGAGAARIVANNV